MQNFTDKSQFGNATSFSIEYENCSRLKCIPNIRPSPSVLLRAHHSVRSFFPLALFCILLLTFHLHLDLCQSESFHFFLTAQIKLSKLKWKICSVNVVIESSITIASSFATFVGVIFICSCGNQMLTMLIHSLGEVRTRHLGRIYALVLSFSLSLFADLRLTNGTQSNNWH